MRIIRQIGSLAFVLGLFVSIFGGAPWHVIVADDPPVPLWLKIAVFALLGGILVEKKMQSTGSRHRSSSNARVVFPVPASPLMSRVCPL